MYAYDLATNTYKPTELRWRDVEPLPEGLVPGWCQFCDSADPNLNQVVVFGFACCTHHAIQGED